MPSKITHALRNGGQLTITVAGPQASGKTLVMDAIRSMLEQAGLVTVASQADSFADATVVERRLTSKAHVLASWPADGIHESELTTGVMNYAAGMAVSDAWEIIESPGYLDSALMCARIRLAIAEICGDPELKIPNLSPRARALYNQIGKEQAERHQAKSRPLKTRIEPLPPMQSMPIVSDKFRDAAIALAGMVAGSESGETSQQFAKIILDEVKAQ